MTHYPFKVHTLKSTHAGDIAYVDEGTGTKTILFIHGLSNYAMGWVKNINALRRKYRCIAIDLPGNGQSSRGDYPYSMHFYAAVVEDFIMQLGLKQLCLAGHSMGAQIALTLQIHRPDIAESLILFAPAGFETFTAMEVSMYEATLNVFDLFASEEASLRKSIQSSFYHYQRDADPMIKDLIDLMHQYPIKDYRRMVDGCIRGMLREPVFNSLHLVSQPAMIVFGDRDALIPNKMVHPVTTRQVAEAGTKKLKQGQMHIIPQGGHFVQWEKAEVVNGLIEKFLG